MLLWLPWWTFQAQITALYWCKSFQPQLSHLQFSATSKDCAFSSLPNVKHYSNAPNEILKECFMHWWKISAYSQDHIPLSSAFNGDTSIVFNGKYSMSPSLETTLLQLHASQGSYKGPKRPLNTYYVFVLLSEALESFQVKCDFTNIANDARNRTTMSL